MSEQLAFFAPEPSPNVVDDDEPQLERFAALARYFNWLSKHDPDLYARVLRSDRVLHLVPNGRAA